MPTLFDQSIFKYNDLGYYTSGDLGVGPNIGYRWLIWLLSIKSIDEWLPIFLAFSINIFIDIGWIYLLSKYINTRALLVFAVLLGSQPYAAIYTIKFSTIIFAKIGLLFFCRELFNDKLSYTKQKILSLWDFLFWTIISLLRNSNLFIAVPYLFLKLRKKPIFAILISLGFLIFFYFLSGGLGPLIESDRPWSLIYMKELLGLNYNLIVLPLLFIARVILLFGAREKVYGEGIEPFLIWGIPGLELCIYIFLGVMQFLGFYISFRFFYKRYGFPTLIILIPLILALITVTHQRYLIPFIPICLFGISLLFNKSSLK